MAGRYKPYLEYKDSRVEWIGDIPVEWSKSFVKHWLISSPCYGILKPDKYDGEGGVKVIRILDVSERAVLLDNLEIVSPLLSAEFSRTLIKSGDLIVSVVGTLGRSFICRDEHEGMNLSRALARMQVESSRKARYLQYVIDSNCFEDYVSVTCNGAAQKVFNMEDLSNWSIPSPDEYALDKIANFLDHETAKIDTLIERQQQLIHLLKEKRQAVISHAVTKGLNPNAKMRDSGVEWLGDVPEHWIVKNYRYATKIYRGKFGHRPRNDPAFYDGAHPFIQTGDIARAGKKITTYTQTLNERGIGVSQKFPSGTLVMAIAANIGDTAILDFEAYAPDSVVGFKPNSDIDLEFLRYSLLAALPALEQTSTQSTQANLNIDRIGTVKGAFPPVDEQFKIISTLDSLLERYAEIELKAAGAIEVMQERRTALISATVTGKIDVRDWVAPSDKQFNKEVAA